MSSIKGAVYLKIGEKIRNAREDLGLSQDEVSRRIPMNQSSYSKIERDLQEPNLEQLRQICRILNLSADSLLALKGDVMTPRDAALLAGMKILIGEYTKKN